MGRNEDDVCELAASVRRGTVIAAAGCGKTEQIARATARSEGRRLILTHTHAGVDALTDRLTKNGIAEQKYHIDTIAGWALRFAAAFPQTSGLKVDSPLTNDEWNAVYEAATKLLRSGSVSRVITVSYSGLFVDEYQDCTLTQHELICALADEISTCLFGDPMQAIFGFRGNRPVDWATDVFPHFPKVGELVTPWRWANAENEALAGWLTYVRQCLETNSPINLVGCPSCVRWRYLPPVSKARTEIAQRRKAIFNACASVTVKEDQRLIVIGDSANLKSRTSLAQSLAQFGFSNIEPVGSADLFQHASLFESRIGFVRLEAVLDFVGDCMTGSEKTGLLDAVKAHQAGRRKGAAKYGDLIRYGTEVVGSESWVPVLTLLEAMRLSPQTHLFRREMFFAMRTALHMVSAGQGITLTDAVWETQNRLRHVGRRLGKWNIGSTLLVKGLEFDHAVVVDADRMTQNDLYVALTRATRSLLILSRSQQITPRP